MIGYIRRLNEGLPGLLLGILIYGFLVEIPVLIFAERRLYATVGLWYGVLIAAGMAVNMASVIYDSVSLGDFDRAKKWAVVKSMLRYIVVAALFFVLGLLNFGSLPLSLIGVMGLKASAYLQPFMAVVSRKLVGDNWMYPRDEENAQEELSEVNTETESSLQIKSKEEEVKK